MSQLMDPPFSFQNQKATEAPELTPLLTPSDGAEFSLRPKKLHEYMGQTKVKRDLEIFLKAARLRNESLDHTLLCGPPGLGKTTLAHIIANELGANITVIAGPNLEKKGDLAAILTHLGPQDLLFVDEIHRLPITVEEVLYSALEDFKLDIVMGQGPSARTLSLDLAPFTLIGATTRQGMLSNPLRDRFGIQLRFDFYTIEEIEQILMRTSQLFGLPIHPSALKMIAQRARGTPRIANRLLKRLRDYAMVHSVAVLEEALVEEALTLFEIDTFGLDRLDRKYLEGLVHVYSGGPVGIETLSAYLAEEKQTLEDVIEPYLLQQGFIQKTPKGRIITARGLASVQIMPKTS